jgi:hypothetical protein
MSPNKTARIAGLLYLVPLVFGPFSMMYVPSRVIVAGDAAATVANLAASEGLFRVGLLSDALIVVTEIALTAALYVLLKPAGKMLAATAAFARLTMATLQAVNLLPQLAALALLHGAGSKSDALVLTCLNLHGWGVHVWEIPFALHCMALGALVFRSGFFPRPLGVLLGVAGLGYAANGFGNLVVPSAAPALAGGVAVTAIAGEVPFLAWLLFKGPAQSDGVARKPATISERQAFS